MFVYSTWSLKKVWLKNWFLCHCNFGNLFLYNVDFILWVLFFLIFEYIKIKFFFEYWKASFMLSSLEETQFWKSVCSVSLKRASVLFLSEIGLTALRSDEVIDLMIKEYPAKHAEYSVILQEKERQRITDHYKEYSVSIEVTRIWAWEITFYKVRCNFQL